MPFETEKDGVKIVAYEKPEVDALISEAIVKETVALKVTNKQLKDEKTALAEKERIASEAVQQAELDKAKTEKDSVKVAELLEQQKMDLLSQIKDRDEAIKREKSSAFLAENVNSIGLGGELNNDLETLLKSRLSIDYDIESGAVSVKDAKTGLAVGDLKKYVTESGRYAMYISAGGASGAGANGGQAAGVAKNPFIKGENFNLTEQARLLNSDPAMYKQLKAQA